MKLELKKEILSIERQDVGIDYEKLVSKGEKRLDEDINFREVNERA